MFKETAATVLNWAASSAFKSELFGGAVLGLLAVASTSAAKYFGYADRQYTIDNATSGAAVGVLAGLAYSSYNQFDPYVFGGSVLCAAAVIGFGTYVNSHNSQGKFNGIKMLCIAECAMLAGVSTFVATPAITAGASYAIG